MSTPIDEKRLLRECRAVLLLLENGEKDAADGLIAEVDELLRQQPRVPLHRDLRALWTDVGIASSNPESPRFLDEARDELNRLAYILDIGLD